MNFIAPFSLPLPIDKGSTAHPLRLLLSHYLKRGRENEFYSLWSYLSPQTAPPSEVAHSATIPLSHYLTQRLEMNFTAHALSSPHSTILQLLIHSTLIVSLPLSFAALKKEKINFTAPSPP